MIWPVQVYLILKIQVIQILTKSVSKSS